jgi:hypothetical protein
MSQIFHPSTNTISKVTILGLLVLVAGGLWLCWEITQAPWVTQQSIVREQPVPFSHEHHVGGLGLDCRYCHNTVEKSAVAGIPPTETCMTCHSQIWTNAAMLEPVRQSYKTGKPLKWTRVHDLPDFVYFDHSIHIAKGIGCESCHGRVDKMPLMWEQNALTMKWCLDCHRNPAKNIRPRDQVFKMGYVPAIAQEELGPKLVQEYKVNVRQLTNCSICHR